MLDSTELAYNKAGSGGAVYDSSSDTQFDDCRIVENFATADEGQGGAIFDVSSNSQFTNCTSTDNSAADLGGAISATASSSVTFTNCILWGDT